MSHTFDCLYCGRKNPVRGANYTNKYCNNQCQQDHRKQLLAETRVQEWLSGCGLYVWKVIPNYIQQYLIKTKGHRCEVCNTVEWQDQPVPLNAVQKDHDIYNNTPDNLMIICPNCQAQRN